MRLTALVAALSLAVSGCALSMEAIAHHNSGGTACLESPVFGGIDLLIAGGIAALVVETDESYGWFAVSGVFGASGLAGIVSAYRCRGSGEPKESDAPPASNSAPSFGDAPVDPEARPATQEEMYGTAPPPPKEPPKVQLFKNGIPTGVPAPPPPQPKDPDPQPPNSGEPKKLACKLEPKIACPDGYYCQLVAENTGECVPIR